VPKFIFNGDEGTKLQYLRGHFDAEGCVPSGRPRITYTTRNLVGGLELLKLLGSLNINCTKSLCRTRGSTDLQIVFGGKVGVENFSNLIGFNHPERAKKLDDLKAKIVNIRYYKKWPDEEIKILENSSFKTAKELSFSLKNRTKAAITQKLQKLGLSKNLFRGIKLNYEVLVFILDMFEFCSAKEVQEMILRKYNLKICSKTVSYHWRKNGLMRYHKNYPEILKNESNYLSLTTKNPWSFS